MSLAKVPGNFSLFTHVLKLMDYSREFKYLLIHYQLLRNGNKAKSKTFRNSWQHGLLSTGGRGTINKDVDGNSIAIEC